MKAWDWLLILFASKVKRAILCLQLKNHKSCLSLSGDQSTEQNIWNGIKAMCILFLVLSALALPNGPFIRPHPIFWRVVFGISVLYTLILQFTLYQTYEDIKKVLGWFDPIGLSRTSLFEKVCLIIVFNIFEYVLYAFVIFIRISLKRNVQSYIIRGWNFN